MTVPRIIIATPVDGRPENATVSHGYHIGVRQLERAGAIVMSADLAFCQDLVKARSRCVHRALQRPDWDWMLWWDDDVIVPDTRIVPRMLAIATDHGYEMIGAPYPMKRSRVQFPYKPVELTSNIVNECIEVERLAFGFMLTSRSCLERMVKAYEDSWFTSQGDDGTLDRVVAIFKQAHLDPYDVNGTPVRELLSEDYSFCYRWRFIGGKVMMFVGPGAPVAHMGGHVYQGKREELGNIT